MRRSGRILLINPPRQQIVLPDARRLARMLPTGLACLAGELRAADWDVRIFDAVPWSEDYRPVTDPAALAALEIEGRPFVSAAFHLGAEPARIQRAVASFAPDFVGISSLMAAHQREALEVAALVKTWNPDVPVVFGGNQPSRAPADSLASPWVDHVVIGEGEGILPALLDDLCGGGHGDGVPGVATKRDDEVHVTPAPPLLTDLDALPLPALSLLPLKRYFALAGMRYAPLITGRGCPYQCAFCGVHAVGGYRYRVRSIEAISDEIRWRHDAQGIAHFLVEDDHFNLDAGRTLELCEAIARLDRPLSFYCPDGISVHRLDEEQLRAMRRAGFRQLTFGLESTSASRRKTIRKAWVTDGALERSVAAARTLGFEEIGVFLIPGLPGETLDDLLDDLDRAAVLGVTPRMNAFYPIPGTTLHAECQRNGWLASENPNLIRAAYAIVDTPELPRRTLLEYVESFFALRTVLDLLADAPTGSDPLRRLLDRLCADGTDIEPGPPDTFVLRPHECSCAPVPDGPAARPACTHFASRLGRMLSLVSDDEWEAEEIRCRLHGGDKFCDFRVTRGAVPPERRRIFERMRPALDTLRRTRLLSSGATSPPKAGGASRRS